MNIKVVGASWCGQCKAFTPKVKAFCEEHKIPFTYIDAEENEDFVSKYGVRNVPVVFLFDDDDFLLERATIPEWDELKGYLI